MYDDKGNFPCYCTLTNQYEIYLVKKNFYKIIHCSYILQNYSFKLCLVFLYKLLFGYVMGKCSNNLCWLCGMWIYHRDGDFANSFTHTYNFYNLPLREVLSLEKWFPLQGERGHSSYCQRFKKQNREEGDTE